MSKNKVLVVDDYPENIKALRELLGSEELEIFGAESADEALALLTQHEFCLALLDVQMPLISGFELARLIRGVKKFRWLPIIFVTASPEDQKFVFEGYESGAVDLLFKPLNPHAVRAKVKIFVQMHEQKMQLQAQLHELESLRIAAEAANFAKSQFLANMSHEIRTPLGAVLGFSQLLTKGALSTEQRESFSAAIKRNGTMLLALVDDILDLSRIEANRLELECVEFDLREVFEEIQTTLSLKAKEKSIELKFIGIEGVAQRYRSDPTRFKQVLLNLVGNAIKFTPQGSVTVEISGTPQGKSDLFQIVIRDQGIGLSPEQAEKLFRPFAQADTSTRRQYGGSGLGLIISQQIVKLMGGNLRLLESTPGQGSTFEITIPFLRSEAADNTADSSASAERRESANLELRHPHKHILAVDDVADNLTLIREFLQQSEIGLDFASNGFEAVEKVKVNHYDLILMDIQMPGMDGYEATSQIRKLNFNRPIVALTAHAIPSERSKCISSGCDDVWVKPITRQSLLARIDAMLINQ